MVKGSMRKVLRGKSGDRYRPDGRPDRRLQGGSGDLSCLGFMLKACRGGWGCEFFILCGVAFCFPERERNVHQLPPARTCILGTCTDLELATFQCAGRRSTNWATPASADVCLLNPGPARDFPARGLCLHGLTGLAASSVAQERGQHGGWLQLGHLYKWVLVPCPTADPALS